MKALKLTNDADERTLIEAAKRDPARFGELYQQNIYQVYAYVSRRVERREEAEDITADVFHHALRNLKSFEWRGSPFLAWLVRIAANRITDRWRSRALESGTPVHEDVHEASTQDVAERAALFQLVRRLPQDQQRVVTMRFVEDKSIREIARELGRSEGAVKQLQFRALEKLRASVEGDNG